jgi:disulfide bond formation protein DsbB
VTTADFSVFFALLALACWGGTAFVLALAIATRRGGSPGLRGAFDDVCGAGLWLAFLVALVTTLGSLYYSEIAHFTPCKLCWYQRIAMYPLTFTLFVAALRNDRRVASYVVPVAVVGAAIAVYHTQLQAFPHQHSSFCTTTEPCTVRYVWEFGFVSLPFMALSAFAFIITITTVVARRARVEAAA